MTVQTETWPRPHRLTVDEYYRMAEVGLLAPDARVELIEGEIIDMAPVGDRHAGTVIELTRRLVLAVEGLALVSVHGPVRLGSRSEPQPDFAIARLRDGQYRSAPTAADVLLIVEVSDTTLRYDRDIKAKLYARHGIPEVWIADLDNGLLHTLRNPRGETYSEQTSTAAGVMQIPGVGVAVDLTNLF